MLSSLDYMSSLSLSLSRSLTHSLSRFVIFGRRFPPSYPHIYGPPDVQSFGLDQRPTRSINNDLPVRRWHLVSHTLFKHKQWKCEIENENVCLIITILTTHDDRDATRTMIQRSISRNRGSIRRRWEEHCTFLCTDRKLNPEREGGGGRRGLSPAECR